MTKVAAALMKKSRQAACSTTHWKFISWLSLRTNRRSKGPAASCYGCHSRVARTRVNQ